MNIDTFHACATCINFQPQKNKDGISYFCKRLGYETKPAFKFNCWEPKEHVKKLIEKRVGEKRS